MPVFWGIFVHHLFLINMVLLVLLLMKKEIFIKSKTSNTEEASKQKIEGIENKITMKEDDKYYSYIGMTSSIKVAEEIQKIYKKKGIDIYIKTKYIEEENLINQIKQYDVLLESSKTIEEINSVLKTVLATYDEIMTNS